MFRKVLDLILAIAGTLDLGLDAAKIREAILAGLKALSAAAAATPAFWDDLLLRLAVAFVESDAWELIWAKIKAHFAPKAAPESAAVALATDEVILRDAFERIEAAAA